MRLTQGDTRSLDYSSNRFKGWMCRGEVRECFQKEVLDLRSRLLC